MVLLPKASPVNAMGANGYLLEVCGSDGLHRSVLAVSGGEAVSMARDAGFGGKDGFG